MESIKVCVQWFIQKTKTSPNKKALLFNTTGNRDSTKLLLELCKCGFNTVIFVPNVAKKLIQDGKHQSKRNNKIKNTASYFQITKI